MAHQLSNGYQIVNVIGTSDQYFNILSLDGGGIKGIYSAKILAFLEQEEGINFGQDFDLICGTSTGGLIALALAAERSANSIADFYITHGNELFPYVKPIVRQIHYLKSILFKSKYSHDRLTSLLKNFFGEHLLMNDLSTNVCIPAYCTDTGRPVVFKKSTNPRFFLDKDVPVVDVALATSAAPTYFPIHEISGTAHRDGQYTDGGLWANDPSSIGLLEALQYLNKEKNKPIRILSISAIPLPPGLGTVKWRSRPAWKWGSTIFDFAIQGQMELNHRTIGWLSSKLNCEYLRIEPTNLSSSIQKQIEMDLASTESIELLTNLATLSGSAFVRDNSEYLNSFNNQ